MTTTTASTATLPPVRRSRQVRGALWASLGIAVLAVAGLLVGTPASVGCCAAGPSLTHPLGLDAGGRDLLQLVLRGLATSSVIVLASSVLAVVFGALYGAVVAALPRDLRTVGMRLVDVVAATPITLIVITLMVAVRAARPQLPSVLDPVLDSRFLLVFCVASLQWLSLARVVYGRLAFIAERPFVRAARIAGMSPPAVFLFHLLPHARGPLFVFGLLALPSGVVAEGFFSFLGFGVEAPEVSLGTLVAAGARAMSIAPLTLFAPAVVLVTATIALQVLGARLRDDLRPDESSGESSGERQTR